MTVPGFSAEASLYLARRQYRSHQIASSSNTIIPGGMFGPAKIQVRYSPSLPFWNGLPRDFDGSGENFAADTDVIVTVTNCDAFPYQVPVHTNSFQFHCPTAHLPLYRCTLNPGGEFTHTFPCFCGGAASVTAQDPFGNMASGTAHLPC